MQGDSAPPLTARSAPSRPRPHKTRLAPREQASRLVAQACWPTPAGPRLLAHACWPTPAGPRLLAHACWPSLARSPAAAAVWLAGTHAAPGNPPTNQFPALATCARRQWHMLAADRGARQCGQRARPGRRAAPRGACWGGGGHMLALAPRVLPHRLGRSSGSSLVLPVPGGACGAHRAPFSAPWSD